MNEKIIFPDLLRRWLLWSVALTCIIIAVIMDIRMPDRNGIDIAAALVGKSKVVLTTGAK